MGDFGATALTTGGASKGTAVTSPKSGPAKTKASFSLRLEKARQLVVEDGECRKALEILEQLHQEKPQTAQVWVLLAHCYKVLDEEDQADSFLERFQAWFSSRKNDPAAMLLNFTYQYLDQDDSFTFETVQAVLDDKTLVLTTDQKRELAFFAGELVLKKPIDSRSEDSQEMQRIAQYKQAKCLLEQALKTNYQWRNRDALTLQCLLFVRYGRVCIALGKETSDTEEKQTYFKAALKSLNEAITYSITSQSACLEWKSLLTDPKYSKLLSADTFPVLPKRCDSYANPTVYDCEGSDVN
jgi:tetratricopeptide (TPR) repeat protein